MIILTDKAKTDFGLWHFERRTSVAEFQNFDKLSETAQYAVIIEWFDSVGIHIEVAGILGFAIKFHYNILQTNQEVKPYGRKFEKRILATKEAIIVANEIYNER
jgi:hypothetical protein